MGLLAFLASTLANATLINETSDAGQSLVDALLLPGGTTGVAGQIDNDVDLFGFSLASDTDVTLSAVSGAFDMNLLVFNASGQGLAGNDDLNRNGGCGIGARVLDSCLMLSLVAGDYFFAVGVNNVEAFDVANNFVVGNDSGILGTPSVNVLDNFANGQGGGAYRVSIDTPSTVPAPASLALFGLALLGLRATRRQR